MRSSRTVAIVAMLAASSVACGYALAGRGSFLPAHIRTIGVPEFANSTPYYEVERLFTEKVRSELIGRGKYRVLPQSVGVDAVLKGTITSMTISPANFNQQQQATRYTILVTTSIEFIDLATNKTIWSNRSLAFREVYDLPAEAQAGDPTAFFGQSSNALQRVAADVAHTIISAILEAF